MSLRRFMENIIGIVGGQWLLFPRLNMKLLRVYGRISCRGRVANLTVGKRVVIRDNVTIVLSGCKKPGELRLEDGVVIETGAYLNVHGGCIYIQEGAFLGVRCIIQGMGGVTIGRYTMLGPNVQMYSSDHRFEQECSNYQLLGENSSPIAIGDNVWLGANCIVLRGTTIGEGAVVGAGTIVKGSVRRGVVLTNRRIPVEYEIIKGTFESSPTDPWQREDG